MNSLSDNFIAVQGAIRPLKVMRKSDWLQSKQEMSKIKQELALLNPETMYCSAQIGKPEGDKPMKDSKTISA